MNAKVLSDLAYLTSAFLFIIGLKFLSHPARARRGNLLAVLGMAFALVATFIFLWSGPSTPLRALGGAPERGMLVIAGILIGGLLGTIGARWVAITNMPQMVALLNGCGGGAAALISTVEFVGGKSGDAVGFGSATFGAVVGSLAF